MVQLDLKEKQEILVLVVKRETMEQKVIKEIKE